MDNCIEIIFLFLFLIIETWWCDLTTRYLIPSGNKEFNDSAGIIIYVLWKFSKESNQLSTFSFISSFEVSLFNILVKNKFTGMILTLKCTHGTSRHSWVPLFQYKSWSYPMYIYIYWFPIFVKNLLLPRCIPMSCD